MYAAALDIPNIPGFRRDYAQRNYGALSRQREQLYRKQQAVDDPPPPPAPGQENASEATLQGTPPWLVQPGDTLRFRCYFEEPVVDHPKFGGKLASHKMRVRKMTLTYFLQDKSIAMHELRTENSGIVQGRFLKRTQLFRDDGSAFTPSDFRVGGTFSLNMRVFTVVDADTRTRRWFLDELQDALPPALPFPDDGFEAERAAMAQTARKGTTALNPAERQATSTPASDKAVLRFYCAFQDNSVPGRETVIPYVMHYYVEDDTIEVKATKTEGLDHFPYLLRRQKLPLNSFNVPGNDNIASLGDQVMVMWEDLRCGGVITVYGHVLVLLSCDARTTDWFAARGITQRPLALTPQAPDAYKGPTAGAPPEVQPYNGFGAEDDEYAMGLTLEPREGGAAGREAYSRFMDGADKVLRFVAKRVDFDTESVDEQRTFVINYFLGDDTVSVYEPERPNSGIRGGLFLSRMRYKKYVPVDFHPSAPSFFAPADPSGPSDRSGEAGRLETQKPRTPAPGSVLSRWFRPSDLTPGADVTFEMPSTGCPLHRFVVVDYDDYTRAILEGVERTSASATGKAATRDGADSSSTATEAAAAHARAKEADESLVDELLAPGNEAKITSEGRVSLLLCRLSELFAAHRLSVRSALEALDPLVVDGAEGGKTAPGAATGALRGRIREEQFVKCLRGFTDSNGAQVVTPQKVATDDLDLLVWEFAAPGGTVDGYAPPEEAPPPVRNGYALGHRGGGAQSQQSHSGIFVEYGDFCDALVLAWAEPDVGTGGARAATGAVPRANESVPTVEESILQKLRHQSVLVGAGAGGYGLTGGAGGRLRRSFRELDQQNQAALRAQRRENPPPRPTGNEPPPGTVTAEQWFSVLRKHRFHDLLNKSRAEAMRLTYAYDPAASAAAAAAAAVRGTRSRQATRGGLPAPPDFSAPLDYNALCDAIHPADFDKQMEKVLVVAGSHAVGASTWSLDAVSNRNAPSSSGIVDQDPRWRRDDEERVAREKERQKRMSTFEKLKEEHQKETAMGSTAATGVTLSGIGGSESVEAGRVRAAHERMDSSSAALARAAIANENRPPTLTSYLKAVNDELSGHDGDMRRLLQASMQQFASAFARAQRKKLLRKNFMAFDVSNSGFIKKAAFLAAVEKAVSEGFIEVYNETHTKRIADFFFPQKDINEANYEKLLEIICSRDADAAVVFREAQVKQKGQAWR